MGNRTFSIILRLIIIIAVIFATSAVVRRVFPRIETNEIVRTDTVWTVRDSVVYIEKPVIRWRTKVDTLEVPVITNCDSLRVAFIQTWMKLHETNGYGDTIAMDSLGSYWYAYEVSNNEARNFTTGHHFEIPSVTTTINNPYSVYIGAIGGRSTLAPCITLTKNKNAFTASYNVVEGQLLFGYSRKIFSK